jgi:hypothetical protein
MYEKEECESLVLYKTVLVSCFHIWPWCNRKLLCYCLFRFPTPLISSHTVCQMFFFKLRNQVPTKSQIPNLILNSTDTSHYSTFILNHFIDIFKGEKSILEQAESNENVSFPCKRRNLTHSDWCCYLAGVDGSRWRVQWWVTDVMKLQCFLFCRCVFL